MRLRKEFLENIFFVFGSLLTCAMVLWIAKVQAATDSAAVIAKVMIPIEAGISIETVAELGSSKIPVCSTHPSETKVFSPFAPLSANSFDIASILNSRHAVRPNEEALRTNLPIWDEAEEAIEVASSDTNSEDSMEHLCSAPATNDEQERKTFSLSATRLLCEAIGSNEDLFENQRTTFIAFRN